MSNQPTQPAKATDPFLDSLKFGTIIIIGQSASPLPLEHTTVSGHIVGPVASVAVEQRFGNPWKAPIEVEYLFPLSHEAAIVDFQIKIGERTIRADIRELQSAREAYDRAIAQGKRTGLLEERRPNLLAIKVGNVQPGENVLATLRYDERLHYVVDSYQFVFPMGITPKYHADPAEAQNVDAPVAAPSQPIVPVAIKLEVEAAGDIDLPSSPSHPMDVKRVDERRFEVSLSVVPDKDFVLRYRVAGDAVKTGAWLSQGRDGMDVHTALISILPPRLDKNFMAAAREFVFVLDRSGSMSNAPIQQARHALQACLRTLTEKDSFAIQVFDDRVEWFSERAQAVTQATIDSADAWLNGIEGRGGTEIVRALESVVALPVDASRQRYVVFLTDGAVSAEQQVYDLLKRKAGDARVFTFGIGSSVNRALLAKMAELGRGKADFLQLNEDIEKAITRFADRVSYPALQNLQIHWEGVEAWDTYPAHLPDLYVGDPLEVVTRLKGQGTGKVSGQIGGQQIELTFAIPQASTRQEPIDRLWALARLQAILDDSSLSFDSKRQQIISLSLENRILSPYTGFVAVDSEVTAQNQPPEFVRISQPLPQGVDFGQVKGGGGGRGVLLGAMSSPLAAARAKPDDFNTDFRIMNTPIESMALRKRLQEIGSQLRDDYQDESAPRPKVVQKPIPDLIKWLARTQNLSGSWGRADDEGDQVERTAAALLAFVRAGHTTRSGDYRRQVSRAVDWLKKQWRYKEGFAHFARWRALTELQQAENNAEQYISLELEVGPATTDAERAAVSINSTNLPPVPTTVASLDDLRIVALVVGEAQAHQALLDSDQSDLLQTWLAVGKAMA